MAEDAPDFADFGEFEPPKKDDAPDRSRNFKDQASDAERISSLATSMRVVEDRYSTLRKKLQMTDNTLIEAQREFERERKLLDEERMECKERIEELEETVETMRGEIEEAVNRRSFRYLKKYVEYWDPSRFISRDEAESMLGATSDARNV